MTNQVKRSKRPVQTVETVQRPVQTVENCYFCKDAFIIPINRKTDAPFVCDRCMDRR